MNARRDDRAGRHGRRVTLLALVLAFGLSPLASGAQEPGKVWRIGYLAAGSSALDKGWRAAFQDALRELGYVEGRNIAIEWRHADGRPERLERMATELVGLRVDVVVSYGGTDAVKKASSTMPIVVTVSTDPVGLGYAQSLSRPGGQVTGLSDRHGDTVAKRLALLKEIVPSLSRVGVLMNPTLSSAALQLKDLQSAAPRLRITLVPVEIRGVGDIDAASARIQRERLGALFVIADRTFFPHGPFVDLALRSRLPVIGTVREFAEAGYLLSYGTSFHELWRRAATYVDKILKGASPGDLPFEQASKWELVVNMKTARAVGLAIPPAVLLRADHVIE
jgi:putative ABC transport system substrate-binding protein